MTTAERLIQEGRQEGMQEGRQEGIQEGRQEGIRQGSYNTYFNLIQKGI